MADDKPKTINEEAGLGPEWVPIDAPPIVPGTSAPTTADGSSKYLTGSLPPNFQHDVSFTGTAYKQDRTPQLSLMPLGVQGDPSTNAGGQSTSSKTLNQALPGVISNGLVFPATLDNVADSPTFGRVVQLALTTNQIDPSKSGVLAKGSTPVTQNTGLSYTSTSSAIDLIWNELSIYRADGTLTSIGSSSQNVTGLAASTTYYTYPYFDESSNTFKFVLNSDLSIPVLQGMAFTSAGAKEVTTTTTAALTAAFSISFWTLVSMGSTTVGGITKATNQTGGIASVNTVVSLRWDGSGHAQADYKDSGGTFNTLTSTATFNDNAYHHFCYVCDPTNSSQILYVDGVAVASGVVATSVSATSAYYRLSRSDGSVCLDGTLTEVAVFNVALTPSQVLAQYNSEYTNGNQSAYEVIILGQAPTIWWKMTDPGPTVVADSGSIGGNTGTAVNSPTFQSTNFIYGAIGTPAIMWQVRSVAATQFQNAQSRVPFTFGGWAVATVASGSGGGVNSGSSGGTGGGGCFSGATRIQTIDGNKRIDEIKIGDFVYSKNGLRKVLNVVCLGKKQRVMIQMIQDELVTAGHLLHLNGKWQRAEDVLLDNPIVQYDREVFNLTLDAKEYDDHSYYLANGQLAHNTSLV